ncbi:MAG: rhomboid family intramembrane serine protease, partial [Verrucomicrobiota bacterium]
MGVGDRTYMRGARPASEARPLAHWTVGLLVLFFIVGLVGDSARADLLGWAVIRERGTHAWQWITYALVHEGFWHLLGNGLMLWWTGAIVERERGPRVFVGVEHGRGKRAPKSRRGKRAERSAGRLFTPSPRPRPAACGT